MSKSAPQNIEVLYHIYLKTTVLFVNIPKIEQPKITIMSGISNLVSIKINSKLESTCMFENADNVVMVTVLVSSKPISNI